MTDYVHAPNKEVHATLAKLFAQIGEPISPYGDQVLMPMDCLDLIASMYGPKAAGRCRIEIMWH
jgi:hypothetical protein